MPKENKLPSPVMVRMENDMLLKLKREEKKLRVRGISAVIRAICREYFEQGSAKA